MVKINWVSLKIWPNTNTSSNSIARIWSEDLKMPEIILSDKTIEYRRQKGPNYRLSAKFLNDIMKRSSCCCHCCCCCMLFGGCCCILGSPPPPLLPSPPPNAWLPSWGWLLGSPCWLPGMVTKLFLLLFCAEFYLDQQKAVTNVPLSALKAF